MKLKAKSWRLATFIKNLTFLLLYSLRDGLRAILRRPLVWAIGSQPKGWGSIDEVMIRGIVPEIIRSMDLKPKVEDKPEPVDEPVAIRAVCSMVQIVRVIYESEGTSFGAEYEVDAFCIASGMNPPPWELIFNSWKGLSEIEMARKLGDYYN